MSNETDDLDGMRREFWNDLGDYERYPRDRIAKALEPLLQEFAQALQSARAQGVAEGMEAAAKVAVEMAYQFDTESLDHYAEPEEKLCWARSQAGEKIVAAIRSQSQKE